MSHITLSIYDYSRNKLCDIYDSENEFSGHAYDISVLDEIGGWKEVTFTLPFMVDGVYNFRWDYIKNEYLLRYTSGDSIDWYIVSEPKETKNGKAITSQVTCGHLSSILKTKNLYLTLDDETGIDTAQNLVTKVLTNTGWTLGTYDTMYEPDGTTEKVRTVTSDGKSGSYQ